jgi:hypothetical protein
MQILGIFIKEFLSRLQRIEARYEDATRAPVAERARLWDSGDELSRA